MKRGKKSIAWDRLRAKLKIEFAAMGLTFCESCGSNWNLRFCHRLKRRFITTESELRTVALLCEKCDTELEYSGHTNLYEKITAIIDRRDEQINATETA